MVSKSHGREAAVIAGNAQPFFDPAIVVDRTLQKSVEAEPSPPADVLVKDGDIIPVGELGLKVIHTPGHTPGGISLHLDDMVFTGDTLFVGGVGRTDLPGGSWEILEASIRHRLFTLPDETVVLPGHNYGPAPTSTIRIEKLTNPNLRL